MNPLVFLWEKVVLEITYILLMWTWYRQKKRTWDSWARTQDLPFELFGAYFSLQILIKILSKNWSSRIKNCLVDKIQHISQIESRNSKRKTQKPKNQNQKQNIHLSESSDSAKDTEIAKTLSQWLVTTLLPRYSLLLPSLHNHNYTMRSIE